MEKKKDLAVYILSRNDLPSLNPGKAMAQIHHAGVQMMSKYHKSALVKELERYNMQRFSQPICISLQKKSSTK